MPWYHTLSRKGWIAPHWPEQYGGMGATLNEQLIMTEEMARIGAPHLPVQGLNHIGPILMEFGTAAQKAKHLPPIIAGAVIWAQGYSEPGAGSDLASLSTRATLEGDHFVVRGQKIWTTWAHHSDWMFALVRTDPQAQPRHAGISFLLIDLHRSRRSWATKSSARFFSTTSSCPPKTSSESCTMAGASPMRCSGMSAWRPRTRNSR
jgi:alkylation response protein AidB-like acyl-CoA dehydrogenase